MSQKVYTVSFELSVESDSIKEAVEDVFNRLNAHHNDWIWKVTDESDGKKYEVDYEFEPVGINEIK